jgi:GNAT superfamily N-acetyltransferase
MLDPDASLGANDAERLAGLHRASLTTSTLARLGRAALARYYQWVAASPNEYLFLARSDGGIEGAAVLSFEPDSMLRRFAAANPIAVGAAAAATFLTDAIFRRELGAYLRAGGGASMPGPEVLQIFVAAPARGRSIGSQLLERVEAVLRTRGTGGYYVRTLLEDNTATRAFYERRGFTPTREIDFCGTRYLLLSRTVPDGR